MARNGLDGRHRDTTGRIDKKHGNTRIGSLRKTYGEHFAEGGRKDIMLKTLLAETRTDSLHVYLRKHHKQSQPLRPPGLRPPETVAMMHGTGRPLDRRT